MLLACAICVAVLTSACDQHAHDAGACAAPRAHSSYVPSNRSMQEQYMRRAIELAQDAVRAGGSPYGTVIADPRIARIVAEGRNNASVDPIWHGEMSAITNLSDIRGDVYAIAGDLELYTTAEPCPMCMSTIVWSGFAAVYYGTSIPYLIECGRRQINLRAVDVAAQTVGNFTNTTVVGGVLKAECDALYPLP